MSLERWGVVQASVLVGAQLRQGCAIGIVGDVGCSRRHMGEILHSLESLDFSYGSYACVDIGVNLEQTTGAVGDARRLSGCLVAMPHRRKRGTRDEFDDEGGVLMFNRQL